MQVLQRKNDNFIDSLELLMAEEGNKIHCPLVHIFTPGMYVRQIFMPKGSLITSKIHKTEHPFIVSMGAVEVSIDGGSAQLIKAPYTGVTQPGTRRILLIQEDCVWTTFHALPFIKGDENELSVSEQLEVVEKIEALILEPYENKLLEQKQQEVLECHS